MAILGASASPVLAALPNTSTPTLSLDRTIRTSPFVGSTQSIRDGEGSVFVPNDPSRPNSGGTDSLWLIDDNGRSAWEVNPYTGALKARVADAEWQATKQYDPATKTGSGPSAGQNRDPDLESMAYDSATDTLYAFNGKCCSSSVLPTAYRLKRVGDGRFHPESWQPLPAGSNYTAAGSNPADGRLYVGVGSDLRSYDYASNTPGTVFHVSNLSGILGMSFSADGADLFVVNSAEKLHRVTWATRTLRSGWSFDLTPFGVRDSRAVDLINDQFYVLDGYDGRSSGDPLRHAVFVFNVCCGTAPAPAPTASFTWAELADPPLTVQFTDSSTGNPSAWDWDFGDGSTATTQNPRHTYTAAGSYAVRLVASSSAGSSDPVTRTVNVSATPTPPGSTFTPISDSFVNSESPNSNYGTSSALKAKLSDIKEYRSYLTFSVTGLQGKAVSSARLRLYVTDSSSSGGALHTVASDWVETGTGAITWNNAPPVSDASVATVGTATAGTWVDLDLTGVVTGEGSYQFAVKSQNSNTVYYSSREGTQPPQLVLTLQ